MNKLIYALSAIQIACIAVAIIWIEASTLMACFVALLQMWKQHIRHTVEVNDLLEHLNDLDKEVLAMAQLHAEMKRKK